MLLRPAMELKRLESTTAEKVIRVLYRGLRVYSYPRVYPTLGRTTTGNGYSNPQVGSGRVENLTYGSGRVTISKLRVGSGRVVKTVYPQTPNTHIVTPDRQMTDGHKKLGFHRISASASANSKFGHFSKIRLRPNFWPNLADANATAVRSVSYLITDNKKLSYCWETVRRESMPRIAEMLVEMKT